MTSALAAAAAAAIVSLGAAAAGAPPGASRLIGSPLPGFELRYPAGWQATLRSDGGIAISTFKLPNRDAFPARPRGSGATPATRALALRTVRSLRTTAPPLPNDYKRTILGRSVQGRPIRVFHFGDFNSHHTILVIGCIHGTECAGMSITLQLLNSQATRANVWVIQDLNPDGLHAGTRVNADGVDLNRNFSSGWRPIGQRDDPQYSGPRPFSEPETRIARSLIERIHPRITIWFHQPADLVRAYGQSIPAARRYARLTGLPFRRLPWLAGTAPHWQNHHFPGASSFVVELPPGPLPLAAARRDAAAVLRLAAAA